jgi:opacity protein-like surface antigen
MHLHGDFSPSSSTVVGDENERSAWAAGGRIGYLVTPTVLTYFNGGYTQTRFDQFNFSFSAAPATPSPFVIPGHNYRGWFIGGGMEFALTVLPIPGFFWRNEYRYSSYQSADLAILATPPIPPTAWHSTCATRCRRLRPRSSTTELDALISSTFAIVAPGDRASALIRPRVGATKVPSR